VDSGFEHWISNIDTTADIEVHRGFALVTVRIPVAGKPVSQVLVWSDHSYRRPPVPLPASLELVTGDELAVWATEAVQLRASVPTCCSPSSYLFGGPLA